MTDDRSILSSMSEGPDDLVARLGQAIEQVRRTEPPTTPEPLRDVATAVAAPAALGLVLWAVGQAREAGVERMYFAGRNGRMAWDVHRRVAERIGEDVPGSYVRVSRNVVRRASALADPGRWIECGHHTSTSFLRQHADVLPLKRLLARAVESPDAHAATAGALGLDLDAPLPAGADDAWRALFDAEDVRAAIRRDSEAALPVLVDWLGQHDFLDHGVVGLVDVGWRGQQAAMLDAALRSAGGPRVVHLHLGRNRSEPLVHESDIRRWLIDVDRPVVPNPVALFETLFATDEAGLEDLERGPDGEVRAVLRRDDDPVARSVHIEPTGRLVTAVVDAAEVRADDVGIDLREVVAALTHRFWESPTPAEARWWGAVPYELDSSGRIVRPLAPPVGWRELGRVLRTRSLGDRQWGRGAVLASAPPIRLVLDLAQRRARSADGRG